MLAQRGLAPAFAQLIARYERTALAVAYAITGNTDSAGDVTQDAFLRSWQRIGSLKDPARFGPWLLEIVRHCAGDYRRHNARHRSEDRPPPAAALATGDPFAQAASAEMRQRIAAALSNLDELSRSAVVLRYYQGLSSWDIAQLLGLSTEAVDMRLSRARSELRNMLVDPQPHSTCQANRGHT